MHRTAIAIACILAGLGALVAGPDLRPAAAQNGVQFLDPLDNTPLEVPLPEDASEAVVQFHETGENAYADDEEAMAEGRRLYERWCQSCHLRDGSGRIGPSLIDDAWKYERTHDHVGQFEIIYAGGAGAMQAFAPRLSQDEILQVIAYMDQLQAQAQP